VLTILSVFPDVLDLNGDAQNALVLARRARWAGLASEVFPLELGQEPVIERPGLIVVGSGTESAMASVLTGLRVLEPALQRWVSDGIPLLAVGTGWELLGEVVEFSDGTILEGLGIFSAKSAPATRIADDVIVDSEFGRLIGFENHSRAIEVGDSAALGRVVYGVGNSSESRLEGERTHEAIGTRLHGPILAKNPALADHLLGLALGDRYDARTATTRRVDDIARAARNQIAARLGLSVE
jgi:CobQ-like glutamine amidotransferase family enzyme